MKIHIESEESAPIYFEHKFEDEKKVMDVLRITSFLVLVIKTVVHMHSSIKERTNRIA